MSSYESSGHDELSAIFTFPPDFPGFQGHFPGKPVLPAVCMLQAVTALAAKQAGHPAELKKVTSAKWFAPTTPGMALTFRLQLTRNPPGDTTIKAKISHGSTKVADLVLTVAAPGTKGAP